MTQKTELVAQIMTSAFSTDVTRRPFYKADASLSLPDAAEPLFDLNQLTLCEERLSWFRSKEGKASGEDTGLHEVSTKMV